MRIAATLAVALALACSPGGSDVRPVTQQEVLDYASRSDAPVVLDVRTPEEFAAGRVPGAINIPHTELASRLSELPDKDREVVVYCQSGRRAALGAEILVESGYHRVGHLEGDMKGWRDAGLPVEGAP